MTPREIDALVAAKVMGYAQARFPIYNDDSLPCFSSNGDGVYVFFGVTGGSPWSPSTDISDAFQVVEKIISGRCGYFRLDFLSVTGFWYAAFGSSSLEVIAEDGPMAICLAALKTVGVGE